MRIEPYLILSTAHLSPATRDWLSRLDFQREGPCGGPHPYGWTLFVHDDNLCLIGKGAAQPPATTPFGQFPPDLWACFVKARQLGCSRVHFDCDEPACDLLSIFEDLEDAA